MRNLCIDIGNTRTKIALFEEATVVKHWTFTNGQNLQLADKGMQIDGVILSSTANVDEAVMRAFMQLSCPIHEVLTWQTPVPVVNLYSTPQTLGMDRLAAVVGAHAQYPTNDILVIDNGTAITYDFVNAHGQYLGGNISPGVALRFKALHTFTARLPLVEEKGDKPAFGTSTDTAIRCGVLDGVRHEIEGFINAMIVKYPNLLVFLTGGHGFDFDVSLKKRIFADKLLVLKGLDCILRNLQAHPTDK